MASEKLSLIKLHDGVVTVFSESSTGEHMHLVRINKDGSFYREGGVVASNFEIEDERVVIRG